MNQLFKSVNMYNQYIKYKIPSLYSEIYLIKWFPNSKTKIHNHRGKNCNFITLNGSLSEKRYLKNNKIVMFTESTETGMYLLKELSKEFPNEVLFYSSEGGRFIEKDKLLNLSQKDGRNEIRENFDPNIKNNQKNNVRILISTDVLAEGINLHRSNVNLNYDLPYYYYLKYH